MRIDLHTHTIASDGLLAPEALVALAHDAGVGVLAVADHDSTDGVDPAMTAGRRVGMEIIPAVEINTDIHESEIHILGYYVDHHQPWFQEYLVRLRAARVGDPRAGTPGMGRQRRGDHGAGGNRAGGPRSLLSSPHPSNGDPLSGNRPAIAAARRGRDRLSWRRPGDESAAWESVCAGRVCRETKRAARGEKPQTVERRTRREGPAYGVSQLRHRKPRQQDRLHQLRLTAQ